jgi:MFS family permease
MIPVATWAGRLAVTYGRKPVFMLGFGVLPGRGVLYTLSGNPYALVSIQLLDGVGAGIFGVLSVLVVADLTRGTGRFNITNGWEFDDLSRGRLLVARSRERRERCQPRGAASRHAGS